MTTNADLLVMSMRYEAEAREAIEKLRETDIGVWSDLRVMVSREGNDVAAALRRSVDVYIGIKHMADTLLKEAADDAA